MEDIVKQHDKEFQINEGRQTDMDGSMYEQALKDKYKRVMKE